jgi:predicted patatin/cPLA2 family phospholipase
VLSVQAADLHPVAEVLLGRARAGSRPGERDDPFRLGLVVEGGAMRGVVSGGMAAGLEALALRDAFDVVYGSSAGACAGAYFLAGQAQAGARLYFEDLNNRRFINLLRGFRGRPIVDLHLLFDDVLRHRLPLDFGALKASGIALVVLASRVDGATPAASGIVEPTRLSNFEDAHDLLGALHASSRVPIVGGPPVAYRGMRFWDAAVTQPIPIHAALADGCTHVLVLLTLPRGTHQRRIGLVDRLLIAPRIAAVSPALAATYLAGYDGYQAICREIFARHDAQTGPPYVGSITVSAEAPIVSRFEIRAERLNAGARAGGDAVLSAFGRGDARLNERLAAVDRQGHPRDVQAAGFS